MAYAKLQHIGAAQFHTTQKPQTQRTTIENIFNELEWLGSHLDPLEQAVILNNLDKLITDQSTPNLMERIKRGERLADIFASSPPLENPNSTSTMTQSAPRRRRRVSAAEPAGAPASRNAVALEACSCSSCSDAATESSSSPGNGLVPGNSRKRCRDAEE